LGILSIDIRFSEVELDERSDAKKLVGNEFLGYMSLLAMIATYTGRAAD
jgi:nucleoside permease NupC